MGRAHPKSSIDSSGNDPFLSACAPPIDETPEARSARIKAEALAKKRSDEIDARIAAESHAEKKKGKPVKVLLLGQSESGKSTTLKNFQLTYARKAWSAEKEAWRAVIQLNLVRSVTAILDAISHELQLQSSSPTTPQYDQDYYEDDLDDGASIITRAGRRRPGTAMSVNALVTSPSASQKNDTKLALPSFELTDKHRMLVEKLVSPLKAVQAELEAVLGSGAAEEDEGTDPLTSARSSIAGDGGYGRTSSMAPHTITNGTTQTSGVQAGDPTDDTKAAQGRQQKQDEFFVRSSGWKNALQRLKIPASGLGRTSLDGNSAVTGEDAVSRTLAKHCGEMEKLWKDGVVREIVKSGRVKLMDCSAFYLDHLPRIATTRYSPSDDDVIRARLRTIGVQEHRLILDQGPEPGRQWLIYDVGGSRTSRAAWPSYFDDVHAILFLAPVSGFDETLREDRRVNRLDDSLQLWKLVCGHRLLKKTELVLFLNKTDVLERKLGEGKKFGAFVRSYEGPNEAESVVKFLKAKFTDVCRHYSKEHRGLHVHFTSVIDTKATAKTLSAVQDGILRQNLQNLALI